MLAPIKIKKGTVGIIASVEAEILLLGSLLRERGASGKGIFEGRLSGRPTVLFLSGMGKVNAAHAATRMIYEYAPALIVNIGIGGAYPSSGLTTGDIAVADREVYGDEGVLTRDGFRGTDFIGIPLLKGGRKKYFNEFPLDRAGVRKALRAAGQVSRSGSPLTVRSGTFLTLSSSTGTRKRALELQESFGALCENMEGAAIAHICALYGIPMIEMRGISNIVENRDLSKWNIRLAAENCQKAVVALLESF